MGCASSLVARLELTGYLQEVVVGFFRGITKISTTKIHQGNNPKQKGNKTKPREQHNKHIRKKMMAKGVTKNGTKNQNA